MDVKHISFDYEPYRAPSETDEEYKDKVTKKFYLQLKKYLRDMDFSGRVRFNAYISRAID